MRSRSPPKPSRSTRTEELAPNERSVTLAWSLHLLAVIHYQASNFASALDHGLAGVADLPGDRSHRRRGPDPAHDRRDLPVDGRSRPGDRDLSAGARRQRATRPVRHRRDGARQPRPSARSSRPLRGGDRASDRRRSPTARDHAPLLVGSVLADLAEAYVGCGDEANAVGLLRAGPRQLGSTSGRRWRARSRRATRRHALRGSRRAAGPADRRRDQHAACGAGSRRSDRQSPTRARDPRPAGHCVPPGRALRGGTGIARTPFRPASRDLQRRRRPPPAHPADRPRRRGGTSSDGDHEAEDGRTRHPLRGRARRSGRVSPRGLRAAGGARRDARRQHDATHERRRRPGRRDRTRDRSAAGVV